MARKVFKLTRVLKAGMTGEDVRKFQHWLNIVQLAYNFSPTSFTDGITENGQFTSFVTTIFYHRFLDMAGYPINHVYDAEIHEWLCYNVNMALEVLGDTRDTWYCK